MGSSSHPVYLHGDCLLCHISPNHLRSFQRLVPPLYIFK